MGIKIKAKAKEFYSFYNNEVQLGYDPEAHVYLLETEPIPSVTTIIKIIDKSAALINWAVKLTTEKILHSVVFPITDVEGFRELIMSAKGAHREKLEDAGNVGKIAHSWIEEWIKTWFDNEMLSHLGIPTLLLSKFPEDERAANCCRAALMWAEQHHVRWIHTERKIYSRIHRYAGTLDGIAIVDSCQDRNCCPVEFKDRKSLIDWKSSNQLYNEYLFQTAAYQYAYEEETGEEIEDRWIIRLGKDDGEFEAWHMTEGYEEDFRAFEACLSLTKTIDSVKMRMKERKRLNKIETEKNNVKETK